MIQLHFWRAVIPLQELSTAAVCARIFWVQLLRSRVKGARNSREQISKMKIKCLQDEVKSYALERSSSVVLMMLKEQIVCKEFMRLLSDVSQSNTTILKKT